MVDTENYTYSVRDTTGPPSVCKDSVASVWRTLPGSRTDLCKNVV